METVRRNIPERILVVDGISWISANSSNSGQMAMICLIQWNKQRSNVCNCKEKIVLNRRIAQFPQQFATDFTFSRAKIFRIGVACVPQRNRSDLTREPERFICYFFFFSRICWFVGLCVYSISFGTVLWECDFKGAS